MRPATTATVKPDPHTNELSEWNLGIIKTLEYITNYIKYAYSYTATSTWVCLRTAEQGENEGVFRRMICHCCVPSFQTNEGSIID